ncbi:MAG TPA: hypothetical protein VJ600_07195 [Holophagaceae bacterium]|nr:hypothetical protein [Holophagaceae bacterium]
MGRIRWVRCLVSPVEGFRAWAAEAPSVASSLRGLFAWRLPLALLQAWLSGRAALALLAQFRDPGSDLWREAMTRAGAAGFLEDLRTFLESLPAVPAWERFWPWLLPLVPVGLLGLWLHDAAWDHAGLWLLRGLRKDGAVRATLAAEAVALTVGTAGVAIALLALLPGVSLVFSLVAWPLGAYLWLLRGVALAAFHGCPTWKGVVATILHLVLFLAFACCLLAAAVVLALAIVGSAS